MVSGLNTTSFVGFHFTKNEGTESSTVRGTELLHVVAVSLDDLSARQMGSRRVEERLIDMAEKPDVLHRHATEHHSAQSALSLGATLKSTIIATTLGSAVPGCR